MYQRQIIIEVQNGGYLNKDAKLDFKFKFNGKFGKFKRLSSEEISKLSSEHIIEYHSDLIDYTKFLKKISSNKKAEEFDLTAKRVWEYLKRRKLSEYEAKQSNVI